MNHSPPPIGKIAGLIHRAFWQYGTCRDSLARRHRITGAVQFVLWKKGSKQCDYIYPEDWWYDLNSFWWDQFKSA